MTDALDIAPGACGEDRFARVTYAEADALADQVAQALLAAGLRRGERVLTGNDDGRGALAFSECREPRFTGR